MIRFEDLLEEESLTYEPGDGSRVERIHCRRKTSLPPAAPAEATSSRRQARRARSKTLRRTAKQSAGPYTRGKNRRRTRFSGRPSHVVVDSC